MTDLITLTGNVVDHKIVGASTIPLEGVTVTATPSREVTSTSDGSDAMTDAPATSDENGDFTLPLVHAAGLQYRITYRVGGRVIHRGTLDCDSWAAGSTVDVASLPPIAGVPPSAVEDLQAWVLAYVTGLDVDPAVIEQAVIHYLTANPVGIPAHNDTTGRDAADAHPMASITGLDSALAGKVTDDDTRLADARTPTAHAASHASGGSDAITPASIGAATPAQLTSGDSATLAAAQSHAQGLVDALTAASPATLDTLAEIASALGEDPNFAATMTTALGNRVRFDAAQTLTVPQQGQARTNIGAAPALGTDDNYVTDAEKVKLSNLSGTNTGDQDLSGYATTASLAAVATTGVYADLSGTPTIPDSPDDIGAAPATQTINAQTGTAYTLVAGDAGKLVTLTNAAAITLNAPGSVFTAGQRVDVLVLGTGMATVVGTSGATVNGTPTLVSRARYSAFSVVWLTASSAVVVGDLAAS